MECFWEMGFGESLLKPSHVILLVVKSKFVYHVYKSPVSQKNCYFPLEQHILWNTHTYYNTTFKKTYFVVGHLQNRIGCMDTFLFGG